MIYPNIYPDKIKLCHKAILSLMPPRPPPLDMAEVQQPICHIITCRIGLELAEKRPTGNTPMASRWKSSTGWTGTCDLLIRTCGNSFSTTAELEGETRMTNWANQARMSPGYIVDLRSFLCRQVSSKTRRQDAVLAQRESAPCRPSDACNSSKHMASLRKRLTSCSKRCAIN
jgi:hypothetical protein